MSDQLLEAVSSGLRIFDLGRPMYSGMPQSPNHPKFTHTLPRRHGDMVREDGGSASNDLLVTGTHVGTHIDSLAHVSQDGKLFGGVDAQAAGVGGRFMEHGVHTIAPMVCRGVMLDIPGVLGINSCEPGYEITPDDLEVASKHCPPIRPGDVVLIRSGWGQQLNNGAEAYLGNESGVPGVGAAGAHWLSDRQVLAAGADTVAFECLRPGKGHSALPVHRILLVEGGIYIIEALELEALAAAKVYEFIFILTPLNIVGATGSPVRPLAVVSHG